MWSVEVSEKRDASFQFGGDKEAKLHRMRLWMERLLSVAEVDYSMSQRALTDRNFFEAWECQPLAAK